MKCWDFLLILFRKSFKKGSQLRRCPDGSKLRNLRYDPKRFFAEGLAKTIKWYSELVLD